MYKQGGYCPGMPRNVLEKVNSPGKVLEFWLMSWNVLEKALLHIRKCLPNSAK